MTSSADLPRLVGATRPGTKATVQVWRKGQTKDLTVVVAELQDEKLRAEARQEGDSRIV